MLYWYGISLNPRVLGVVEMFSEFGGMIYYKTSQPVPGKGDAWMFYECDDDETIRRYLTFIPATGDLDKVPKPYIKKLQRPDLLMHCSQEEFYQYWPPEEGEAGPNGAEQVKEAAAQRMAEHDLRFDGDMTVGEAMSVHPKVAEVFAAFHLGGCSNCGISEFETVAQVCMGYGVDVEVLLSVLEGLLDEVDAEASDRPAAVE